MMKHFTKLFLSTTLLISCTHADDMPRNIISLDNSVAENFTISDYDDRTYELKQSRGRWVFLHFWASWCGPCRKEMPVVFQLQQQLADKPIDFVIVNTAEDEDTIFSFLGTVAPDVQSYMDRDGELTEIWQPRGLPTTFFIDPQGRKRYMALGGRPWEDAQYQKFLQLLFEETRVK